MAKQPNVLYILTDQQKANAIRMYCDIGIPTPNMERLAARGIRYEHAYTPHPLCVPARISLWTGRFPHQHGSRTNEFLMPAEEKNFAGVLREAGYRLALFGKNHCFPDDVTEQLFEDRYIFSHHGPEPEDCENEQEAEVIRWIRTSPPRTPGMLAAGARVNPFPAEFCPTAILARRTVRFIENYADERPLFAWLSIPDPHSPLQCPEPYASMHPPESIVLPPWRDEDLDEKMERARVFRDLLGYDTIDEETIRKRVSIYYGMIRFIDDALGEILDALDRTGMAENTIIVFTSDHGDYSGEHRMTDKSSTFVEAMTRVPLIVSWPGHLPEGVVEPGVATLLDTIPTCLALAGIPIPEASEGRPLPCAGGTQRDAVYSEYAAGGPRLHHDDAMRLGKVRLLDRSPAPVLLRWREAEGLPKMIRTGRYKYIWDPADEVDELYDLEADPWELTNLRSSPDYAEVHRDLRKRLVAWSTEAEAAARPMPLLFNPVTGENTTTPFFP